MMQYLPFLIAISALVVVELHGSSPPLGFYPNIILLYADDLGFGDLHNYGHPISITPNLDKIASQGTKIIEFYSSSPVCSPSRAALLTGRFQTRSGIWPNVFGQTSKGGLPHSEITIANLLKTIESTDYATAIIGKWHLGVGGQNGTYLPTTQGFDFYTGIPFSHDMPDPVYCFPGKLGCWPSTWPDPWNDTMRDTYDDSKLSVNNNDNNNDIASISSDINGMAMGYGNNNGLSYHEYRKQRLKKKLINLGILESYDSVITQEMIDQIPIEHRVSENMDYESEILLGSGTPELPLYLMDSIIQQPVNITEVPDYYTLNAKYFMKNAVTNDNNHTKQPFFLYYAFHETHHPQFSSMRYFNSSQRGMFGDSLSELDYNIGQIISYVYELGVENETLIIFSADNGPSLVRLERGGNAGLLKCGKGTTYEGGVRMPGLFWMPNYIESNRVTRGLGSTLDVFPTIAELVGLDLPQNVTYDGYSMYNWIFTKNSKNNAKNNGKNGKNSGKQSSETEAVSLRDTIYYWPEDVSINTAKSKGWWTQSMHAVRVNQFKLHWIVAGSHCGNTYADSDCRDNNTEHILDTPLLFNLYHDQAEAYPLQQNSDNSENNEYYQNIILQLNATIAEFFQKPENSEDNLWGESQISGKGSSNEYAPCCNWDCEDNWPDCCNCGQNLMLNEAAKQYWEFGKIIN